MWFSYEQTVSINLLHAEFEIANWKASHESKVN